MNVWRTGVSVVAWVVGGALLLLLGLGVVLPRLTGHDLYVVTSGSMEPVLHVGSVVVDSPVNTADIKPGDIITFHLNGSSELVTHRVTKWIGEPAQRVFHTKGDANSSADPGEVPAAAIVGRADYSLPRMGYVLNFVKTPLGAGLAALLVVVALLSSSSDEKRKPSRGRHARPTETTSESTPDAIAPVASAR